MDGYDDDEELDAENYGSTREIERRRVYQRKDYKTSGWWWQELQDEDLSDHTSKPARRFRGHFRVPYCFFEELVAMVKQKRLLVLLQTKMIRTPYSNSFC